MGFLDSVRDVGNVFDPGGFIADDQPTSELQDALGKIAGARFSQPPIQKLLPPSLKLGQTGDFLQSGIQGIGQLIQNPGGLGSNVSQSINARVGQESSTVAQNFRGIGEQQAGAAARSNLPVSIRNALSSALDVAQERAQRGVRTDALSESESLRRQDLQQTFNVLDAILQFVSSGRGQGIQGLGASGQLSLGQQGIDAQQQSASLGAIGSLLSSFGGGG